MSLTGRVTRSRSRATNNSESDCPSHTFARGPNMSLTEHPQIADSLSELLKVIEKSVRTSEQNNAILDETHRLGRQNHDDLLQLHEKQAAQLATLSAQNAFHVGTALHPTPFQGKPTDDLSAFLNHFERYANFCGWDENQRLRALPLYFQGNASSWYSSIDTNEIKSYQNLIDALKTHFNNPATIWLLRQQMSSRKQGLTEPLTNYAADIRRLYKRLGLNDSDGMHYFIQGLRDDLKAHVILGQPKSLAEAENLAHLREAVAISTPNIAQHKLENQLQSVVKSLETLANAQQEHAQQVAAYSAPTGPNSSRYPRNSSYQHEWQRQAPGPRHDSDHIAQLVRDEVRRQTRFMMQMNRQANSGVPSTRNRRTTDGLPICNKCDKIGHIARNCTSQHPPSPSHQHQNVSLSRNARPFFPQQASRGNNPFRQNSGN